ncbi:MAG: peptidylprolyl isomerase [Clostridia bacterium]|nr:peptidylprolyl isomerase [Clostridia bacterium]
MKFKKLARALCIGALAATVGGAAAMSGCAIETNHPRAKITIEFNDETYTLSYTLYRNMYPVTVRHFIELAKAGFYDNTIIHDYGSNDWYGGGYSYVSETNADEDIYSYGDSYSDSSMDEYLEDNDLESAYLKLFNDGNLTASVYTDYSGFDKNDDMQVNDEDAYHTLYGEFSSNNHTIANGELTNTFGNLKMYYTAKVIEDDAAAQVYVKTNKKEVLVADYKYNSATSLFAIQVGESSSLSYTSYATFAELSNDTSVDNLNDLLDAIDDYISDNYNDDNNKFTTGVDVYTDNIEQIASPATAVSYTVTAKPIIIKSVKITKY